MFPVSAAFPYPPPHHHCRNMMAAGATGTTGTTMFRGSRLYGTMTPTFPDARRTTRPEGLTWRPEQSEPPDRSPP
jgi:hypothetical protein